MNDFLPKDYETPEVLSNYMTLEEGENSFRVLSSAIVGYKWWVDHGQEGRKPIRVRTADEVPEEVKNATEKRAQAKHFWAFPVYNYHTKSIQVLEIKQQTIMRAIEAFVKNPKWGNPQRYDLVIEKVKTGSRDWDVEYSVIPEPPTPIAVHLSVFEPVGGVLGHSSPLVIPGFRNGLHELRMPRKALSGHVCANTIGCGDCGAGQNSPCPTRGFVRWGRPIRGDG